jgi:plasmid stabilization system protein ParE
MLCTGMRPVATKLPRFRRAVKERLRLICEKPQQYRNTYKNFRESLLKKYPFYIIYFIDEGNKTVIIVSIFHHKRNPAKKYLK